MQVILNDTEPSEVSGYCESAMKEEEGWHKQLERHIYLWEAGSLN